MSVKRYDHSPTGSVEADQYGEFVLAIEYDILSARLAKAEAALRRIWFLDHNERDWESIDEIKAFARAALADEPQKGEPK